MMETIRNVATLLAPLLCLGCLLASGAGAGEDEAGFYASAEESVFVIGLPDYAPANYRTFNVKCKRAEPVINNILVAPQTGITLGWRTDEGLFFEAYGEYASVRSNSHRSYTPDEGYAAVSFSAPGGSFASYYASTVPALMDTQLDFEQYGAELIAGRTFTENGMQISPFVGYWFMDMTQNYHLAWQSLTLMRSNEKVESVYHGLMAGLEASSSTGDWDFEAKTSLGVAWVHNEYDGYMAILNSTRRDRYGVDVDTAAYRGTLEATLSRDIGAGWRAGLSLGGRYLSYVPGIVSSTKDPASAVGNVPAHIKGEATFSGKLGLELSYSF